MKNSNNGFYVGGKSPSGNHSQPRLCFFFSTQSRKLMCRTRSSHVKVDHEGITIILSTNSFQLTCLYTPEISSFHPCPPRVLIHQSFLSGLLPVSTW